MKWRIKSLNTRDAISTLSTIVKTYCRVDREYEFDFNYDTTEDIVEINIEEKEKEEE